MVSKQIPEIQPKINRKADTPKTPLGAKTGAKGIQTGAKRSQKAAKGSQKGAKGESKDDQNPPTLGRAC